MSVDRTRVLAVDATFLTRLGIKPGMLVAALNAPVEFVAGLAEHLPAGAQLATQLVGDERPDVIVMWPVCACGLEPLFHDLQRTIQPNGAIWMVIPKAKFASRQGFCGAWKDMVASALRTDLVDNKTLTFSDQEYGTRFVIRRNARPKA